MFQASKAAPVAPQTPPKPTITSATKDQQTEHTQLYQYFGEIIAGKGRKATEKELEVMYRPWLAFLRQRVELGDVSQIVPNAKLPSMDSN